MFKVGDKIKRITAGGTLIKLNQTYTVTKYSSGMVWLAELGGMWHADKFALVEDKPPEIKIGDVITDGVNEPYNVIEVDRFKVKLQHPETGKVLTSWFDLTEKWKGGWQLNGVPVKDFLSGQKGKQVYQQPAPVQQRKVRVYNA